MAKVTFIHSLFRSGSTYIYNVLKRTGRFDTYHEPLHEIIASLPDFWNEVTGSEEQLKSTLRHDFLSGGYFDEFLDLLPIINKTFDTKFSFDYYFMEAGDTAADLKDYIDALVAIATKIPVIQCTRTCGRIGWLKENYKSSHIFLLRNPWTQWFSYKVDPYIASTPRVIYSQSNLPAVLKGVFEASDAPPLIGSNTREKHSYGIDRPLSPAHDYFLFFGLWAHAFLSGERDADVIIDMDLLSSNTKYQADSVAKLEKIGIQSIDISDANLHRTIFSDRELAGFHTIEDRVLEIYREHKFSVEAVHEYLEQARQETFISIKKPDDPNSRVLEDAFRLRGLLTARDNQITALNQTLDARDEQLTELNQTLNAQDGQLAELNQTLNTRDEQLAELNQTLNAQDGQLAELNQTLDAREEQNSELNHVVREFETRIVDLESSISWKVTMPFRKLISMIKWKEKQNKNQATNNTSAMLGPDAFFTICSKNFLAHARALHKSVQPHYPDSRFFVVLCDRVDELFDPAQEPFEFIFLEDLSLPNLEEMANHYNITEFNTAVKPFAFMRLMNEFHFDSVVYLDPDLYFVDGMPELDRLLAEGAEAVLTPHILKPAENDEIHDGKMLLFGIYNLGFLALRNTPAVIEFLQWWGRRLEKHCIIRLQEGLFVDQKWADLLPAFVSGTRILHHPGYNVAYWNLPQRKITRKANRWFANDQPLRFVHFSGNKLDDISTFSRHSQQVTMDNIGVLSELLDIYRREVYESGHEFYRSLPYAYSWNGATGENLHTPKELDLASNQAELVESIDGETVMAGHDHSAFALLQRRYYVLRQAAPIAKQLSGGWGPFLGRVWSAYRRHGWHYVKSKAVELSGFSAPPIRSIDHQADKSEDSKGKSKRLLYLDWAIPKPDVDAASVTATLLMQVFDSLGYQVTFVPCGLKYEEGYYEKLVADNVEVIVYPEIKSLKEWLELNAKNFDVCVLARGPVVWPYIETIRAYAPNLKLIFNTVDLHYLRELRQAEIANDHQAREAALVLMNQELELIDKCDLTILLSSEEMYTVRKLRPEAPLSLLPVVFNDIPGATKEFKQRRDILFIGSFPHEPNIDAVIYFAEAVFPLIKQQIPDIRFKVIGANPPASIKELAEISGIDILGYVKDLAPVFSDIRLSVAPLRYGAGIKGKIGTSFCYGVPCVATSVAVEGMGLSIGENVIVGDTPEEFAGAVCDVYLNEEVWISLSTQGHKFALENYSFDVIKDRLSNLMFSLNNGWRQIHNIVGIDSWEAYKNHSTRLEQEYRRRILREQDLLPNDDTGSFTTPGFCNVCGTHTNFLTSYMYSTGNTPDGRQMPNWREHMKCEHCGLVNRMRAALNLMQTFSPPIPESRIYITERLTKTYQWLAERYPNLQGSEYFGSQHQSGSNVDGIQHEDVMNLSFSDSTFDRILSFDVLEHVPFPEHAFSEFYRVLSPGGILIFSVPFSSDSREDIVRASLCEDGTIIHHLPAEYHGNPVDPEGGALCFRYFGWEMLEQLREIGFKNVKCEAYWSEQQGYLGCEQYLFTASKG